MMSGIASPVQCSEDCSDLYIGETKQPYMAKHRRATASGQDLAVQLYLKDKGPSAKN